MTLSTTTRKVTYTGDGATRAFVIPFHFLKASEIYATVTVGGVSTAQSGFTISGAGVGAIITLASAPSNGATLLIERTVDLKQEASFRSQGSFNPAAIEDALDKLTMLHQQREDAIAALQTADGSLSASISAEAVARAAAVAAAIASVLATLATELATIRTEFTTQPGSVIDARTILATLGITSRTSADHMADKLNIKDYGATTGGSGASNDAAITAALAVMDFAYVPRGTFTVATMPDLTRLYGPGLLSLGGVSIPLSAVPVPNTPENLFPNSQWQVASGMGTGTKFNVEGTGTKAALVVSAYETGTNTPLCTCANVYDLKVGDLLAFSAAAELCFRTSLMPVTSVGGGGFRVQLPLGLKPSASAACTALPTMAGGINSAPGSGDAFDGWKKTPTVNLTGTTTWMNGSNQVSGAGTLFTQQLFIGAKIQTVNVGVFATVQSITSDTLLVLTDDYAGPTEVGVVTRRTGPVVWREDHAANLKKGSTYSCGFKKALSPDEHLYHSVPAPSLERYKGKRIVVGFGVLHKVKGGSGTWRVFINSDGTGGGIKYGALATGAGGTWEHRELSAVIPDDATFLDIGLELKGNASDTYYVSHPMMAFGRYLGPWNYSQPQGEYLVPGVHIQFHTLNNTSPHWPSSLSAATGKGNDTELKGSDNGAIKNFAINPYAETNGAIAPTVREIIIKIEGRCETVGDAWGLSNNSVFGAAHVFGPLLYSQTNGYMMPPQKGSVPLDNNGLCYAFGGMAALTGTMDFTNGSANVTGYGTKFKTELSLGMLIKVNTNSGNKFYRVKDIPTDTSLVLGVPGGAPATFDEATALGVGGLKLQANFYNFAMEANAIRLTA